jgi:adenylate cyclase class 2
MKRLLETEIKLPVHDLPKLTKGLSQLGFRVIKPRHFESNYLFDFMDLRLGRSGRLLRLRFAGGETLLTFKGPPLRARRYGRRREIETRVEDGVLLRAVLQSLGLKEVFVYEKFRTVFAPAAKLRLRGSPQVTFDETPIGNYVELEGPASWIDRVASRLGYAPRDYITATYPALYFQDCRAQGKKPGNLVFRGRRRRQWVAQVQWRCEKTRSGSRRGATAQRKAREEPLLFFAALHETRSAASGPVGAPGIARPPRIKSSSNRNWVSLAPEL